MNITNRLLQTTSLALLLGIASQSLAQHHQSVTTSIAAVEEEFANILLNADPMQLTEMGLTVGVRFTFTHNGHSHTATLVEEYGDVKRGEWLGRLWEDRVELAISFGNACPELDCEVGDAITISLASSGEDADRQ